MRPHDGAGPFKDGNLLGHAVVAAVKVHNLPEGQIKSISNQKSNKINIKSKKCILRPLAPPQPPMSERSSDHPKNLMRCQGIFEGES